MLVTIDKLVGYIVDKLTTNGFMDCVNLIILADHGM